MTLISRENAIQLANGHLATIDPPFPGFAWYVKPDQELSDAWLFVYAFKSSDPMNTELPLIAGALGYSVSKESGEIKAWAANQWFQIKQQGHIRA